MKRPPVLIGVVLALGGLLGLWWWLGARRPPNVLLVTIDTLRADHVGCYGYAAARTPTLDRLAAEGTRFADAVTPVPITLPAHASIFTGQYPPRHGLRVNGVGRLPDAAVTLAECFAERGYATGAVISAHVLDQRYGLDQGFGTYHDADLVSQTALGGEVERSALDATAAAIRWLTGHRDRPFFLWVHYFDPHYNYQPPEEFKQLFPPDFTGAYDGEIAYTDAALDMLLRQMRADGLGEDLLIMVASDHGESLKQHEEATHGIFLYEPTLRVPWIVRLPGGEGGGKTIEETASLVDLMPTLLDLVGFPVPSGMDGRSWAGRLRGGRGPGLRAAPAEEGLYYAESYLPLHDYGYHELVGVRGPGWKLIFAPQPEFYDLVADPEEARNLYDPREGPWPAHEAAARALVDEVQAGAAALDLSAPDPDTRQRLASLGYAFAPAAAPAPGEERADPKEKIRTINMIASALRSKVAGRYRMALNLFRQALEEEPDHPVVLKSLVEFYANPHLGLGRYEEAISLGERLLATTPDAPEDPGLHHWLSHAHLGLGNYAAARQALLRRLELGRSDWETHYNLACCHAQLGDYDKSLESIELAIGNGFQDWELLRSDPDLDPIRPLEGYRALIRDKPEKSGESTPIH